jgi:hypothetical protein
MLINHEVINLRAWLPMFNIYNPSAGSYVHILDSQDVKGNKLIQSGFTGKPILYHL